MKIDSEVFADVGPVDPEESILAMLRGRPAIGRRLPMPSPEPEPPAVAFPAPAGAPSRGGLFGGAEPRQPEVTLGNLGGATLPQIREKEAQLAAADKPSLWRRILGGAAETVGALGGRPMLYQLGQRIEQGSLAKKLAPYEAQAAGLQAQGEVEKAQLATDTAKANIGLKQAETNEANLRGKLTQAQLDKLNPAPTDQIKPDLKTGQVFIQHPDGSYEVKPIPGWKPGPEGKPQKIDPIAAAIGGEPQGTTWGGKNYGTVTKAQAAYGKAYEAEQRKQKAQEAQTAAEIGVKAAGEKSTLPTSADRTMINAAPKVIYFVDRIGPLVDQLSAQLGPGSGRWNEFWAGKVGAPGAQFTKLRTDVGLLQTQLMRMHVGQRGGEYMMKKFQDLIDAGKQSPENMKAALEEIRAYAQDIQGATPSGNRGANVPTSGSDPLGIR